MSLLLMQKNLSHAHTVLSACLVSLRTAKKPSLIASAIDGATAAAMSDLKSAPKQSINAVNDLVEARNTMSVVTKRLTELSKLVLRTNDPKAKDKISFTAYRKELTLLDSRLDGVDLLLENSRNLINKSLKVAEPSAKNTSETMSTEEFLVNINSTDDVRAAVSIIHQWYNGLTRAEADQITRRRGPLLDTVIAATDSATAKLIVETVNSKVMEVADTTATRADSDDVVRASQAIQLTRALEVKHAAKFRSLVVKENGVAQIDVPLAVTFSHRQIRTDTLAKNGMKAQPFSYEKFNNGSFIVENQHLIAFRRSDAESFHREKQNESRRDSSDIKMLNNLKRSLRNVQSEIKETEAAILKQTSKRARQALEDSLKELKAEAVGVQGSIDTITDNANAAKKLITNKHKVAKRDSNEMVREYADHILELVNERLSIEYAKVSGHMLHKVGNIDYVYMWVAPKHYVRALHAISGGRGDLVSSWNVAWA